MTVHLTGRQYDMLAALAMGEDAAATGRRLWVTIDTIKTHRKKLYRKLKVSSAPQAVAVAYHLGLLNPNTDPRLKEHAA